MYLGRNRADEGGGMIMGGSGIGGVQWSDYSSFENDDVVTGDGIFFQTPISLEEEDPFNINDNPVIPSIFILKNLNSFLQVLGKPGHERLLGMQFAAKSETSDHGKGREARSWTERGGSGQSLHQTRRILGF